MGNLHWIDRESPSWEPLWERFAVEHHLKFGTDDAVSYNGRYNEVWQYMGSLLLPNGRVQHQFRHRMHPVTGRREYLTYEVATLTPGLRRDMDIMMLPPCP